MAFLLKMVSAVCVAAGLTLSLGACTTKPNPDPDTMRDEAPPQAE